MAGVPGAVAQWKSDGRVSLADLLTRPRNQRQQADWDWAHRIEHQNIRDAIQAQTKPALDLPVYPLEPTNWQQPKPFLLWNQQAHDDFNGALQLDGNDLQTVDLKDQAQREAWYELHYQEHKAANFKLKI